MSKVGKQLIQKPEQVEVQLKDEILEVKGPEGTISKEFPREHLNLKQKNGELKVEPKNDTQQTQALWGTWRSLIASMIQGVSEEFTKKLTLKGIGYKCYLEDEKLILEVGFSHPIEIEPPPGISFETEQDEITVKGRNKQNVGNIAAYIRSKRPPEPYNGTGIRYKGEEIERKEGKQAVGLEE